MVDNYKEMDQWCRGNIPYIAGYTLIEGTLFLLLRYYATPTCIDKRAKQWANNVLSIPINAILFTTALLSVLRLMGTHEGRWLQSTDVGRFSLRLYISHNIVNSGIDIIELFFNFRVTIKERSSLLLHHVASAFAFYSGLSIGRMHFWGNMATLCEITNPFLSILLFSIEKEGGYGKVVQRAMGKPLMMVNAFSLWITFLVFRLVLFPTWLFWFAKDVAAMFPGGFLSKYLKVDAAILSEPVDIFSSVELISYPAIISLLLVLSCVWFYKITIGILREIGIVAPKRKVK